MRQFIFNVAILKVKVAIKPAKPSTYYALISGSYLFTLIIRKLDIFLKIFMIMKIGKFQKYLALFGIYITVFVILIIWSHWQIQQLNSEIKTKKSILTKKNQRINFEKFRQNGINKRISNHVANVR